jgi:zinc transport system substrate-binding protein
MPDVKTIAAYQRADLILLNGAGYAKWVNKVTLPQFRRVDTSAGFRDRYIKMANVVTHTHGPTGEHAHEGIAFITWLDFDLAAQHAKAVMDALSRRQPARRATFQRRYATLAQDLKTLDDELKTIVSQRPRQPFVASHPVYDYLARRYGLHIKSVHWEPGELPTESQWAALAVILQEHPARWMIWEGKPHPDVVARLQSMGINSLIFDPLGHLPPGGDFLSFMRQNVENLRQAFQ